MLHTQKISKVKGASNAGQVGCSMLQRDFREFQGGFISVLERYYCDFRLLQSVERFSEVLKKFQ